MAVATSTAIIGGIAAAGGAAKAISGGIQARKARKAIENYDRQDLDNVFEDIQISTIGSDLIREESARLGATSVDALQAGGVRSVMGGLPRVIAETNNANREARQYLDLQDQRRQYAIAQDDSRIRSMYERREEADLAGLGQQLDVSRNMMWNGLGDIASAGMYMGNNLKG